jgi:hypothetical protein
MLKSGSWDAWFYIMGRYEDGPGTRKALIIVVRFVGEGKRICTMHAATVICTWDGSL